MFPLGSTVHGINLSASRPAVICFPTACMCSCSYNLIGIISFACNKISIFLSGQIDFCIKGHKFSRVTNGKELYKPYLELLMGRIYASPNLHKTLIIIWLVHYFKGRIYAKRKKSRYLAIRLWISLQLSRSLQQVSPLYNLWLLHKSSPYNYADKTVPLLGRIYAKHKNSRYLVITCNWLWSSLILMHLLQQVSPL